MDKKLVEDNTIFLTLAGSRAYGTNNETSDYDYRGICIIPDRSYYFGFKTFEQMDKGFEDDRVIYNIRKAINLMADANPNMLELLFVEDFCIIKNSKYWEKIRENREQFLSKKVRWSYNGYAFQQMKRLKNHRKWILNPPKKKPERKDFGLLEMEKNLSKEEISNFEWALCKLLENSIEYMNLSEITKKELKDINIIGLIQKNSLEDISNQVHKIMNTNEEIIENIIKEKKYKFAMDEWNSYINWKNTRNPMRKQMEEKFYMDLKHASHIVRLFRSGMEIMETGNLKVFRPDREELKFIKNGGWTFEELEYFFEQSEIKMNDLYKKTTLRDKPNINFLENLCVKSIEKYFLDVRA